MGSKAIQATGEADVTHGGFEAFEPYCHLPPKRLPPSSGSSPSAVAVACFILVKFGIEMFGRI